MPSPATKNDVKFRHYRFKGKLPPVGVTYHLMEKFKSCIGAAANVMKRGANDFKPSLGLGFDPKKESFNADYSEACDFKVTIGKEIFHFLVPEDERDKSESVIVPSLVRAIYVSQVPFSFYLNPDKLMKELEKFATFQDTGVTIEKVGPNKAFLGKAVGLVKAYKLIPNRYVNVQAYTDDGEEIPNMTVQLQVNCTGFDKTVERAPRPQKACTIPHCKDPNSHWTSSCPYKKVKKCTICNGLMSIHKCSGQKCNNIENVKRGIFCDDPVDKPAVKPFKEGDSRKRRRTNDSTSSATPPQKSNLSNIPSQPSLSNNPNFFQKGKKKPESPRPGAKAPSPLAEDGLTFSDPNEKPLIATNHNIQKPSVAPPKQGTKSKDTAPSKAQQSKKKTTGVANNTQLPSQNSQPLSESMEETRLESQVEGQVGSMETDAPSCGADESYDTASSQQSDDVVMSANIEAPNCRADESSKDKPPKSAETTGTDKAPNCRANSNASKSSKSSESTSSTAKGPNCRPSYKPHELGKQNKEILEKAKRDTEAAKANLRKNKELLDEAKRQVNSHKTNTKTPDASITSASLRSAQSSTNSTLSGFASYLLNTKS